MKDDLDSDFRVPYSEDKNGTYENFAVTKIVHILHLTILDTCKYE